jgi:AcrR family transcriptional regulator
MQNRIKPRKIPQQSRSRKTREDILEATAHLLNRHALEEVSTNHIARKTGISIGTLYKYYPNKDSILADLSRTYMQKDAELVATILEKYDKYDKHPGHPPIEPLDELLDELVDALMEIHMRDARVRGVVYQNLERLKLVTEAQKTRQQIQVKGASIFPSMEPGLTWVTLTAISSIVFSMSQLQPQHRNWAFARNLCRHALGLLIAPKDQAVFDRFRDAR